MGGYDGRRHLSSVEVFNIVTQQWKPTSEMLNARSDSVAVVCAYVLLVVNGLIYRFYCVIYAIKCCIIIAKLSPLFPATFI